MTSPTAVKNKLKLCCLIGLHRWRHIRKTHHNNWMGRICQNCGKVHTLWVHGYEDIGDKLKLSDFGRECISRPMWK